MLVAVWTGGGWGTRARASGACALVSLPFIHPIVCFYDERLEAQ